MVKNDLELKLFSAAMRSGIGYDKQLLGGCDKVSRVGEKKNIMRVNFMY